MASWRANDKAHLSTKFQDLQLKQQEVVETNPPKIRLKLFFEGKEEASSHGPSPPFKGRVKVLGLVANGSFLAWWPMEDSWLGGQ